MKNILPCKNCGNLPIIEKSFAFWDGPKDSGGGYVYSAFCPIRKCQHHQMEYIKNGNEDAARQKVIEKWNKEQENH